MSNKWSIHLWDQRLTEENEHPIYTPHKLWLPTAIFPLCKLCGRIGPQILGAANIGTQYVLRLLIIYLQQSNLWCNFEMKDRCGL